MGLPYSDIKDVTLNDSQKISIQTLNKLYSRMVENDRRNLPSESTVPGIWEKTWLNDASRPGYRKGQAVWINTEDPVEFIASRQTEIYDYLVNNEQYRDIILEHSGSQAELNKLYMQFLDGELYYLGDITKPVQLRVCKYDNDEDGNGVKQPPDNDEYWSDFFQLRDDNSLINQIIQQFESTTAQQFENHIDQFHPERSLSAHFGDYMLNDFSNASKKQQHHRFNLSHMQGFDYVKKFVRKQYNGKSVKWFRLWNSGYLEQGGIFDINNIAGKDTLQYGGVDGKIATVNFGWTYKGGRTAPFFDYVKNSFQPFYDVDTALKIDSSEAIPYDKMGNLDAMYRYFVQLTPIFTDQTSVPYKNCDETYKYYVSRDVTGLTNKSFSFVLTPGYDLYSYYASGFTVSSVGMEN